VAVLVMVFNHPEFCASGLQSLVPLESSAQYCRVKSRRSRYSWVQTQRKAESIGRSISRPFVCSSTEYNTTRDGT
jgi:hypothetical protein